MIRTERRAAIYARVSTDKQNPLSPADQERKCREYARQNGIVVVDSEIYVDGGVSGVGMDRPGLQRLLRAAYSPARGFDVILIDDTSRLSRSTGDVLSIHHNLKFSGLQLIAISQNIDSLQDQAETLFTIHGLIDSTYVRELAKKTHRGCESAVLRGLHVGGRCFGYVTMPEGAAGSKRLAIEESQAVIVRRIFEMSVTGSSLKNIAKTLNNEQTSGRSDWCPTGVRSMLKRELYKGEVIWNRTKFEKVPGTNKRRAKRRDESEWIRVQRPDLAIVPIELWDRVQQRLNFWGRKPSEGRRRGLFSRAITSPYLFSGLLKCGDCGGNLIVGTGGGTHVHKKYVCANYFNRGTCENDLYIRQDILEERLLARLQSELLQPEVIDYAIGEFGRQLQAVLAGLSGDIGDLRKRKEQLKAEVQRLADAIARGGPLDSLVQEIAKREQEVKSITNRLLSSSAGSIESQLREIRQFVTLGISDLRSLLGRDAVLAKAELHSHLSQITMTPAEDGKNWHYLAEGSWNLLGTGPSAPAFGLAHSDGCGGRI
jgi:site-specific DNA recombinase